MPEETLHSRAWPWFVGAACAYGGTVIGTWWPRKGPTEINLIPFRHHVRAIRRGPRTPEARSAWRDLAVNVVLLMPVAVLLAQGFRRTRGSVGPGVVVGCLGSLVIETGQIVIPGRVPDATDVVLNSLGVALSSALVARSTARPARRATTGRRQTAGAVGRVLPVVGVAGGPGWAD